MEMPKLASRRQNRKSNLRTGRMLTPRREKQTTASERRAAQKREQRRKNWRIGLTVAGFLVVVGGMVVIVKQAMNGRQPVASEEPVTVEVKYAPTIEVVDGAGTAVRLPDRTNEYIGQVEADLKELGYQPTRAVIPAGAIREVDFYVEGKTGFIKMTVDKGAGISAEDADRMIRYLDSKGITDFLYIDVRVEGKGFWR